MEPKKKITKTTIDDSMRLKNSCCLISSQISYALNEYESSLHDYHESDCDDTDDESKRNSIERSFHSYHLSNILQNRCRPAIVGKDAEECSLIRDTQEQQKFRKKVLPLAIGSHLMHWPIYQTTLHVYFHYQFVSAKEVSLLKTEADSSSGITLPKTIIHCPFPYADPIHPPENSTLKLFQFNLVAISSESFKTCEWQRTFLKELLQDGKWGAIGERHNFLIPFFLCPDSDTPDFVPEEVTRYSFVLNQHGQFVGDLALKLILPTIQWTNHRLIEHNAKVSGRIPFIQQPRPEQDITEYVMTLYDVYNAYHHLIIYAPLSSVMTRHENNRQLHTEIVELIQNLSFASQRLMQLGEELLLNAAIDAIGVVGKIETGCKVDVRYKESLEFDKIEGLLNGALLWTIASFPEYFLDTEFAKDKLAMRAAVDFLISYFKIFLFEKEFESHPENSIMTIYKFNCDKKLYYKYESNCDTEIQQTENSFAAPTQCMNTNAFRISQYLIEYASEEIEVDKITTILHICLRLCLYRTIPVKSKSLIGNKSDCFPVFPFLRWKSVVGTDRFGNRKPGWSNTLNPLYNILVAGLSFMRRNSTNKDFSNILPFFYEVVYQIFYPVATISDPKYMTIPLHSSLYNNKDFHEWAVQVGKLITRRENVFGLQEISMKIFFKAIQILWKDFELSKLTQLEKLLVERHASVYTTKCHGGFGMLKFEGHLQTSGPTTPERCQSESYGDPIFEALHMQVPLLLFSPEGLNRFLFALQKFAFDAHPVKSILNNTPPYCLYLYRTRQRQSLQQKRASTLAIASTDITSINHSNNPEGISTSNVPEYQPEISKNLRPIDWKQYERIGELPVELREMKQLVALHKAIKAHDSSALSSTTDVSSHISSEWTVDSELESNLDVLSMQEEGSTSEEQPNHPCVYSPPLVVDSHNQPAPASSSSESEL